MYVPNQQPQPSTLEKMQAGAQQGWASAQKTIGDFSSIAKKIKESAVPQPQGFGTQTSTPAYKYSNLNTDLSKLGTKTTDYGGSTKFEKFHPGIDIANKIGTPIPNMAEGTVVRVDEGRKQGDNGYGNSVIVKDAQGNQYRYSHLNKAYVKVGEKIGKGQQLGEMGATGSTYSTSGGTGSHLDFRVKNAKGEYVNPTQFIQS